jgi:hypothetical protein
MRTQDDRRHKIGAKRNRFIGRKLAQNFIFGPLAEQLDCGSIEISAPGNGKGGLERTHSCAIAQAGRRQATTFSQKLERARTATRGQQIEEIDRRIGMMAQSICSMIDFIARRLADESMRNFAELFDFIARMRRSHDEKIGQGAQKDRPRSGGILAQASCGKMLERIGRRILGERTHRGHTRKLLGG